MKTRRQTGAERKISTSFRPPKVPLEEIKEAAWPRVDLSVLFPKSLTCEEVYLEIYLECNKTRNTGTHPEQPWSNGTTGMLEHWNTGKRCLRNTQCFFFSLSFFLLFFSFFCVPVFMEFGVLHYHISERVLKLQLVMIEVSMTIFFVNNKNAPFIRG